MRETFYDLAVTWQHGVTQLENGTRTLEVAAIFDHDYQWHVLFWEWDTSIAPWPIGFTLWFYGVEVEAIPVAHWPMPGDKLPTPPYIESATIAQEWREMLPD